MKANVVAKLVKMCLTENIPVLLHTKSHDITQTITQIKQVMNGVSQELSIPCVFMLSDRCDVIDLEKFTEHATFCHGDKGVMTFIGINRASLDLKQALYELVLKRKVGNNSLPEGWSIVLGSIEDSDYCIGDLDPAFTARCCELELN